VVRETVPDGTWVIVTGAFATGAPALLTLPRTVEVVSCA
jgi:hypothetical protein